MEVLAAREEDVPAIAALEAECFTAGASRELLERMLADPLYVMLCAKEGEDLLGYIYFQYVLTEGYMGNLAVTEACRRRGVGRALVTTAMEAARLLQLEFLTLEVRQSNLIARRLYESCGFQTTAVRKNYYERPREDAVLMTAYFGAEG
jgi:ribosomal-protein-alanine N-acetyltransferase